MRKKIKQYELGWKDEPYRLAGEVIAVERLGEAIARVVEAGPVRTAEMFPAPEQESRGDK